MKSKDFKMLDLEDIQLIDIREQWEWNEYHIPSAKLIPKDELMSRLNELDIDKPVYLICHTWMRTGFMSKVLRLAWYEVIDVEWGYREYYDNIVK